MEGHHSRPKVDTSGGGSRVIAIVAVVALLVAVGGALYYSQSGSQGTPPATAQHSP